MINHATSEPARVTTTGGVVGTLRCSRMFYSVINKLPGPLGSRTMIGNPRGLP